MSWQASLSRVGLTALGTSALLSLGNLAWSEISGSDDGILDGFMPFFIVSFPFVLVGGMIFGLPVYALFLRDKRTGWLDYVGSGLLVGAIAAAVMAAILFQNLSAIQVFAVIGAAGGGLAGAIWRTLAPRSHKEGFLDA